MNQNAPTRVRSYLIGAALALLFVCKDIDYIWRRMVGHWTDGLFWPGSDTRIYFRAAEAWLSGGDPWHASFGGVLFGAPPPSLLVVAPFVPLGESLTVAVWFVGFPILAAVALHKLHLPLWWMLWPPMFEGLWVGSPDVMVIAAMVGGIPVVGVLAKVFAAAPLAILGRWRPLVISGAIIVLTIPILPWAAFLDHGSSVVASQNKGYSAWAYPLLLPAVALSLVVLRRKRAAWLSVPALWPYTQLHYAVLALPVMTPILAVAMSFRDPWALSAGVIAEGLLAAQIPAMVRRYTLRSAAVKVPRYETTTH